MFLSVNNSITRFLVNLLALNSDVHRRNVLVFVTLCLELLLFGTDSALITLPFCDNNPAPGESYNLWNQRDKISLAVSSLISIILLNLALKITRAHMNSKVLFVF